MHIYWVLAPTETRNQLDHGLRLTCLETWLYGYTCDMYYPICLMIGMCGAWCAAGTKGYYRRHKASGDGVGNEQVEFWRQNRNTNVALPKNVIQIALIRICFNRRNMQAIGMKCKQTAQGIVCEQNENVGHRTERMVLLELAFWTFLWQPGMHFKAVWASEASPGPLCGHLWEPCQETVPFGAPPGEKSTPFYTSFWLRKCWKSPETWKDENQKTKLRQNRSPTSPKAAQRASNPINTICFEASTPRYLSGFAVTLGTRLRSLSEFS